MKNMTYLFLDDVRNPEDCVNYMASRINNSNVYTMKKWDIVRSYDEFTNWIEKFGLPAVISFDHDLADEHYDPSMYSNNYNDVAKNFKEKTGMDCAKWLVDYCMDNKLTIPQYVVHSMNPAGTRNIVSYLENAKKYIKS